MWFGYYPEIIFCHFFCNLNLVIFKCTIMAGDINSLNLLVGSVISTCTDVVVVCVFKQNRLEYMYYQRILEYFEDFYYR